MLLTEFNIGYIAFGNLIALAVACLLYQIGGRAGTSKGIRRFGASFVIAAALVCSSFLTGVFSFWFLLSWPLKIAEFCCGYSNKEGYGWLKRIYIGLISCLCGVIFCLVLGGLSWFVLGLQFLVGVGTVLFAFKNPFQAAAEETLVCVLSNAILLFYPFVGIAAV